MLWSSVELVTQVWKDFARTRLNLLPQSHSLCARQPSAAAIVLLLPAPARPKAESLDSTSGLIGRKPSTISCQQIRDVISVSPAKCSDYSNDNFRLFLLWLDATW
jgi:hypothetical protein